MRNEHEIIEAELAKLLDIPIDDPAILRVSTIIKHVAENPLARPIKNIIERTIAELEKAADSMLDAGWLFTETTADELEDHITVESACIFALASSRMHEIFDETVGTLNMLHFVYRDCDQQYSKTYTAIYTQKMRDRVVDNFHQHPEPL